MVLPPKTKTPVSHLHSVPISVPNLKCCVTAINRFTGIQDIYHQYGANPCHVFHMMQGHCNKLDCNHLHDEISFTPEALATYRAYLARHPCPYANKCKYAERGNCFYNHVCPLGASCSRPACGYLHGGEAPKIKVPAGNIGLIPTINRRVLGNPERALPVHTHTSTAGRYGPYQIDRFRADPMGHIQIPKKI
jgi:hypothetical protein